MLTIPSGVRVLIATKPVDFRNYAERTIMQSARRIVANRRDFSSVLLHIIWLTSDGGQHGQEFVRSTEAARL